MNQQMESKVKELLCLIKEEAAYKIYLQAKQELSGDTNAQALLLSYKRAAHTLQVAAVNDADAGEKDVALFQALSMSLFEQDNLAQLISNELAVKSIISEIIQYLSSQLHIDY